MRQALVFEDGFFHARRSQNGRASFMAKIEPDTQSVVVRFAGDSGDGVQLLGSQFAESTALAGSDFATFPDFPAEIRAPVGTTFGVSAFQINLGARRISTAGDEPDVLVTFNPAALKVNLPTLSKGALIILNTDAFNARNFTKANIETDPRETGELSDYRVIEIAMSSQTLEAVKEHGLSKSDAEQCKNFWALGAILWMFGRDRKPIEDWATKKFAKKPPEVLNGNLAALNAGPCFCRKRRNFRPRSRNSRSAKRLCRRAIIAQLPAPKRFPLASPLQVNSPTGK